MSRSRGSAFPDEFPRDQAQIELVPDGEPWPPMTDAELDEAYAQHRHTEERALLEVAAPHTHVVCGHHCVITRYWCNPTDALCFNCEMDLQDSREPRRGYGVKRSV